MFSFKRTKPVPVAVPKHETIAPSELAYADAWGKTYTEWTKLTINERAFCREHVTKAPYFAVPYTPIY